MSKKYITAFIVGFIAMIGWNVFLIQRDERMYKTYSRYQATKQLTEHQRFCASQAHWHPDCAPLE